MNYPNHSQIVKNNIGVIEVPLEDFKTYFLFRHQFEQNPETFSEFQKQIVHQWAYFERYFRYNVGSENLEIIQKPVGTNEIQESLGVAGSLCLSSKIFLNVTQADWRIIPISQVQDLDFKHLASDGIQYLQVESKGSIGDDNQSKTTAVSQHKSSIVAKKKAKSSDKEISANKYFNYGIITVADQNNILQAWFVDPEGKSISFDEMHYKFLARLYYYNDFIRLISERAYLSILLANRISVLQASTSFKDFDGRPLIGASFKSIRIRDTFIATRSRLLPIGEENQNSKANIVGAVYLTEQLEIIFTGLEVRLLKMLIGQRVKDIVNYKGTPSTQMFRLYVRLKGVNDRNKKSLQRLKLNQFAIKKSIYSFYIDCDVHSSSSGVYFAKAELMKLSPNN